MRHEKTEFHSSPAGTPSVKAARHGEQGFTLIEILVVITIIGLIMGLVGPARAQLPERSQGQGG